MSDQYISCAQCGKATEWKLGKVWVVGSVYMCHCCAHSPPSIIKPVFIEKPTDDEPIRLRLNKVAPRHINHGTTLYLVQETTSNESYLICWGRTSPALWLVNHRTGVLLDPHKVHAIYELPK